MFDDLPLTFQAELSFMINKKVLEKVCDKLYTQLTEFELTIQIIDGVQIYPCSSFLEHCRLLCSEV